MIREEDTYITITWTPEDSSSRCPECGSPFVAGDVIKGEFRKQHVTCPASGTQ